MENFYFGISVLRQKRAFPSVLLHVDLGLRPHNYKMEGITALPRRCMFLLVYLHANLFDDSIPKFSVSCNRKINANSCVVGFIGLCERRTVSVDTKQYFHWLSTCKTTKGTQQASVRYPTEIIFGRKQWRTQEFFGGGVQHSVEDRGQRERGSGGVAP